MRLALRYQNILYFSKRRALFFLFLFLLTNCSKSTPLPQNTLRISFNTFPSSMDPRTCHDFVSSTLVSLTYDGLTRCLPGKDVELSLAKDLKISSDGLIYTFQIREAFWSDGTPITAYDFESSWKKILSQPGGCAFLFYPIKNAEKCVKKEVSIDEVGIKALDEKTFLVELENPTPYFENLTAFPSFLCAPSHTDDPFILNGPFIYAQNVKNHEIILKKNPHYWNRENVLIQEIHISIVPDESTALEMFENNELDWLGGPLSPLPPDALEKWREKLIFIPNAASTICTFNTQKFPFYNRHLRKAFALSIDREEIVKKVLDLGQVPATSMLPPSFSKEIYPLTDLEKAKEHLEKALTELNIQREDLNSIVLYFRPTQIDKRLAQTLEKNWEKTLQIRIHLSQLDYKSHTHRLQTKDYQISLASWIAQFDDPMSILARFKDKNSLKNYPGWEDGSYQELLEKANTSPNRKEMLAEAEKIFFLEMPLSPIFHWSSPAICSSKIESIATTPCGGVLFERFKLNH